MYVNSYNVKRISNESNAFSVHVNPCFIVRGTSKVPAKYLKFIMLMLAMEKLNISNRLPEESQDRDPICNPIS